MIDKLLHWLFGCYWFWQYSFDIESGSFIEEEGLDFVQGRTCTYCDHVETYNRESGKWE